jgi:hypothetical protein
MLVVGLLTAMLSGCATTAGAPSNRGWDAPSPAAVQQFYR